MFSETPKMVNPWGNMYSNSNSTSQFHIKYLQPDLSGVSQHFVPH